MRHGKVLPTAGQAWTAFIMGSKSKEAAGGELRVDSSRGDSSLWGWVARL